MPVYCDLKIPAYDKKDAHPGFFYGMLFLLLSLDVDNIFVIKVFHWKYILNWS